MVRTSKNQPSMDAGNMDDLDLDDMFSDDVLFEGLDIELDGMGDIINDEKNQGRKKGSAKSKRASANDDDAPQRRKTKRKTKTPVAFRDEDEEYTDEPPKKKTRKSVAASGKKGKAGAHVSAVEAVAIGKKKKTRKDTTAAPVTKGKKGGPPVPLARGTSSTVAAAGQFGGRMKRGSASNLTKVKRKLKQGSSTSLAEMGSTPHPQGGHMPTPIAFVPKPEPTHGGLQRSRTLFYPFLESVPTEPTMRNRKQYPVLDRISSALNSNLNAAATPTPGMGDSLPLPSEEELHGLTLETPIVQLLLETYEGASEKDKAAFTPHKRNALLLAIPSLLQTIQHSEKTRLLGDLYSMCGVLQRQYNFLKTSLDNMESWCKNEFSPEDYKSTYAQPDPAQLETAAAASARAAASTIRRWKKPLVHIKLAFAGHKEAKTTPPLLAQLPNHVLVTYEKPSASTKVQAATTKDPKKKKKLDKSSAAVSSTALAPAIKIPAAPKTYIDCPAAERRRRIMEKVSQLALDLENTLPSTAPSKRSTTPPPASRQTTTATFIPDEEPSLHTARMWEWLDVAGFFQMPRQSLRLQSPELHPRNNFLSRPTFIQGRRERPNENGDIHQPDSLSLFDRLQSLLVDEGEDDTDSEQVSYEDDDDDYYSDEESLGFLDDDEDTKEGRPMVDLSQLSLEERTFVQLCSVGLIQKSTFPGVELALEENGRDAGSAGDDIVNVIGEMSRDLSDLTARNNSRINMLEAVLDPTDMAYRKQWEEEQASLNTKCQSLLKRNKEKARKNKQKKDDLNLPW